MRKNTKLIIGGGTVAVVLSIVWGIYDSNQRPECTVTRVISQGQIDKIMADNGYEVHQRLSTQKGCYYRGVITPLGLRAVVIYDPDNESIVLSRWDYLD